MTKAAKRARPPGSPTPAANQNADVLPPTMPPEIRAMLGDPPLLPGEDRKPYDDLIAAVSSALKPTDVMEWVLVEEVVHATHTLRFLRKTRAELLRDGRHEALVEALTPAYEIEKKTAAEARELAQQQADRFQEVPNHYKLEVEQHLGFMGLSLDSVAARGLVLRLTQVESIEQMISAQLSRRDRALRQADQWRHGMGRKLRAETQDIVDVNPETGE